MANGNGTVAVRAQGASPLWRVAQGVALVATVAVIVGMFVAPAPTLEILWRLVIPLVPASLLLSPMLWRNVCPLATLEMPRTGTTGKRKLEWRGLARAAVLGMALLGVLVTARHVLFNGHNATDGTVLGIVVAAVAVLALALGRLFDAKVGFCNSLCPVLPVERLYGQSPLLSVPNARCSPCSHCTKAGCIDLQPDRAIPQVLAQSAAERPWFLTHYGAFAAAFPGFVLGYYLADDGPLSSAGPVFGTVALWTVVSYAVVAAVAGLTRLPAKWAMPALGAAAVGIYYWFAAPVLSRTLRLDGPGGLAPGADASPAAVVLRAAAFALVGAWLWTAYARRAAAAPATSPLP